MVASSDLPDPPHYGFSFAGLVLGYSLGEDIFKDANVASMQEYAGYYDHEEVEKYQSTINILWRPFHREGISNSNESSVLKLSIATSKVQKFDFENHYLKYRSDLQY